MIKKMSKPFTGGNPEGISRHKWEIAVTDYCERTGQSLDTIIESEKFVGVSPRQINNAGDVITLDVKHEDNSYNTVRTSYEVLKGDVSVVKSKDRLCRNPRNEGADVSLKALSDYALIVYSEKYSEYNPREDSDNYGNIKKYFEYKKETDAWEKRNTILARK